MNSLHFINFRERAAEWLRSLTRKLKVRTAVDSSPMLDSLVAVHNSSPGRPEPCEGNLVAAAGSCGSVVVNHPWPLLEISLSDFRGLAILNINTYLPTCPQVRGHGHKLQRDNETKKGQAICFEKIDKGFI